LYLLQIRCRCCGTVFSVCRCCWRGQAYCCDECRVAGTQKNHREAESRYRQTAKGKKAHREAENRRGSVLHSWNADQFDYGTGVSVGYNIMQNAWMSVGYNFFGFEDEDFSKESFTAKGPFVQFRFKFDQQSMRDMVSRWASG